MCNRDAGGGLFQPPTLSIMRFLLIGIFGLLVQILSTLCIAMMVCLVDIHLNLRASMAKRLHMSKCMGKCLTMLGTATFPQRY